MSRCLTIVSVAWLVVGCSPLDVPKVLPIEEDAGTEEVDSGADAAPPQRDAAVDGGDVDASADSGVGWKPVADGGGGGGGSGGMLAGSGGGGAPAPAREPCTTAGALRCSMSAAPGARDRCSEGAWRSERACGKDEICGDRPAPGTCQPIAAVCKGSAGQSVCDPAGVMYDCDDSGVITEMRTCQSAKHCQLGIAKRTCFMCIPGEFRCTDEELEKCADDGQSFSPFKTCDTAALCNLVAGDCTSAACKPMQFVCQVDQLRQCNADQTALTDVAPCQPGLCDAAGGQCDVCAPGAKGCDGNTVMTCDAQGQGSSREACPAMRAHCVGMGQCVECAASADCGEPGPCKMRYCNQGSGGCAPVNVPDGTSCTAGMSGGTCASGACDLCSPNPCQNGGACSGTPAAVSCTCAPGYGGSRCEVDPCSPNPCQNDGVCEVIASGASCMCMAGFSGASCETDACAPNSCQHGGACVRTAGGGHTCSCIGGYTGPSCEVDACAPNPCQNGGMCSRTSSGGYSCACTGGYGGPSCEADACAPNPCQHGGTCMRTTGGGHSCVCTGGYGGADCEVDACAPNPCQHGGTCMRTARGGHSCACTGGYGGVNCETDPCLPNPCPAGVACTRGATGASCSAACSPMCDAGEACASGTDCSSGTCTNNLCACRTVAHCTELTAGDCQVAACTAGSCELQQAAAGAACRTSGMCNTAGACEYCGDGTINGSEECEPTATGWSTETCSAACKRRVYKACTSDTDCEAAQYCLFNVGICTSGCDSESTAPAASPSCPPNPSGPEPKCYLSACILICATGTECPAGVKTCSGSFTSDVYPVCGNPPPP